MFLVFVCSVTIFVCRPELVSSNSSHVAADFEGYVHRARALGRAFGRTETGPLPQDARGTFVALFKS